MGGNLELEWMYGSSNAFSAEMNRAGVDFISGLRNLPEPVRNTLLAGGEIDFSSLTDSMKNSARRMVNALASEYGASIESEPGEAVSSLPGCKLRLQIKPKEGFTAYDLEYRRVGKSSGFSFSDYDAVHKKNEEKNDSLAQSGKVGAIFAPEKFEMSRAELLKVPALKQIVSLNMKRVSAVGVLQKLHEKYGISFIAPSPAVTIEKADVSLNSVSLLDAMEKLQKLYPKYAWLWTRGDFLVVRRPFKFSHETHREGEIKLR